jgi:hypothetical protein
VPKSGPTCTSALFGNAHRILTPLSALERPSRGNTQDLARARQPCDRWASSYRIEVFTVGEGVSAGDTLVGSARAWKGAAQGIGLEAPPSGNRSWSESTPAPASRREMDEAL